MADQESSRFVYGYAVYQVEYSRNLLFRSGAQMEATFDAIVDRTRRRLDVPALRTLFGTHQRPRTNRAELSTRVAAVTETPKYGLTIFKVHFGLLTLKGYTKGEHVLRFEAVCHNTKALRTGPRPGHASPISSPVSPACSSAFAPPSTASTSPSSPTASWTSYPSHRSSGATRVGGIDLAKPRARTALAAVTALAAAPDGFSVADLADKVHAISPAPGPTPSAKPPTTSASSGATSS